MLTASFLRQLEETLSKKIKKTIHIRRVTPVSGGSINLTAKVDTTAGQFFLKVNDAFKYPSMFEKEAKGLDALRATNTFTIPAVILNGDEDGQAFMLLSFIEPLAKSKDFWETFGRKLAALHRVTNDKYGYSFDNYIGSLIQSNRQHNNWLDFFIEERIEFQLKQSLSNGKLNATDNQSFQKLFTRLDKLIPNSPASLLHGDLWSGNFLVDNSGNPCLIDPAVYFGHREMDLAMTKLFGGFENDFYNFYHEEYPLEPGFDERVSLYNLYPLLVHVNLFGGQYVTDVRKIVKSFS